jgi:hypothetical protein
MIDKESEEKRENKKESGRDGKGRFGKGRFVKGVYQGGPGRGKQTVPLDGDLLDTVDKVIRKGNP